jgi:hypothetical protein
LVDKMIYNGLKSCFIIKIWNCGFKKNQGETWWVELTSVDVLWWIGKIVH